MKLKISVTLKTFNMNFEDKALGVEMMSTELGQSRPPAQEKSKEPHIIVV